ncbi:hypothetical protein EJ07DRAFT_58130, partial [Lizonia empirigonia]
SRMNDLSSTRTPAQIEAQQILNHLLSKLKEPNSRHHDKYGKWVSRHPRLDDFIFRCVRSQVWTYLSHRWSLDALKVIGGDLRSDARAIYLNGVLGLDKRVRIYIGQASSLRPRIAQHLNFRYRRDNPSLHYHALQSSIYNAIGVLAVLPGQGMGNHTLPGMDEPALLMNVLEMWMCLVFRSLPVPILDEWIPDGISAGRKEGKEGEFGGLNIQSPLDQGDGTTEWVDLSTSEDPLVREYLSAGVVKSEEKPDVVDDVELRKREYAEKARKLNHGQKGVTLSSNTLIVFGVGVVLGFALVKGF